MKLMYGNTPVKSLNIHTFEMNTNDCDMVASDLQAGKTAVARGQKIVGTGKSFSFAMYGGCNSNQILPIPVDVVNTILISATSYPTRMVKSALELQKMDFTTAQEIAIITIDGIDCPITLKVLNKMITIACSQTTTLEVLFGKDEYTT